MKDLICQGAPAIIAIGAFLCWLLFAKDWQVDTSHVVALTYQTGESDTVRFVTRHDVKLDRFGCLYAGIDRGYICGIREIKIIDK